MPDSLMEITTNIACRVQCSFCPQTLLIDEYSSQNQIEGINYGNPAIMSFETFKTCIDKISPSIPILFGGYSEPFLAPECTKMIVYAYDAGHPIQVYSTLVGLKLEDIDKFKHIKFKGFQVHLPDADMFAKIAINKNYLEVLKKLLTSNIKNLTGMTMGSVNSKIKEVLETEMGHTEMISRAGNVESVKNNFERKLGPLVCNRASARGLEDKLDANVLLPNGDVALCCMDYGLQNILGNLIKTDYDSLFQSDSFKKIQEKMKAHDSDIICRNCTEAISEDELNERKKIKDSYTNDKTAQSIIYLYQDLLQRFPDKDGFNYFYSKISSSELSIKDVENSVKQSEEFKFLHSSTLKLKIPKK